MTLRLCFLFSAPLASQAQFAVDYEREQEDLYKSFCDAGYVVEFQSHCATLETLREKLASQLSILHFSGHGIDNGLVFEETSGAVAMVNADSIERLLPSNSFELPRLLFLNACSSEAVGRFFAARGVAHVIAIRRNQMILDCAATFFTRHFYLSLIGGSSVGRSFEVSCSAMSSDPLLSGEVGKFMLLPEDLDHDVELSACLLPSQNRLPTTTFSIPDQFIGRERDLENIFSLLQSRKCLISLTGSSGVGKTSVCLAVAKFASERNWFSDGVFYFDLQLGLNHEHVLGALPSSLPASRGYSLVILDHVHEQFEIQQFVVPLRDSHRIQWIVSSCNTLTHSPRLDFAEYNLIGLSLSNAARLIYQRIPTFSYELSRSLQDILDIISSHPILGELEGVPARIIKFCRSTTLEFFLN